MIKKSRTLLTWFALWLLLLVQTVSAQTTQPPVLLKDCKVTFRMSNASLSRIIQEVEKVAKVKVLLKDVSLNGIDDKRTVNFNNSSLSDVFHELLSQQNVKLSYNNTQRTITILPSAYAAAYNKNMLKVVGKVVDKSNGGPLPGATIIITDGSSSTNKGCVTNADGKFTIEVPRKYSLMFTYLGFNRRSIQITKPMMDMVVELQPDANMVGEVVVTGMSKRSKESFTGDYVTVKGDELRKMMS